MATYALPFRINDFLNRQIAWSRAVIAEIDALCAAEASTDLEPIVARQQERDRELAAMAREYHGLAREWEAATGLSAEDRAAVAERSDLARKLAEDVRERYDRAQAFIDAEHARNQRAHNELRRRRRSVTIYEPGTVESPGFIDREA